jgi:hypothetical protein
MTFSASVSNVLNARGPTTPMCVAPIPANANSQIVAMVLTSQARPVPRLWKLIAKVVSRVVNARGPTTPMCAAPIPALVAEPMIVAMVLTRKALHVPRLMIKIAKVVSCVVKSRARISPKKSIFAVTTPALVSTDSMIAAKRNGT